MNYKAVLTTVGRNIINAAYNAGETVTISTIELGDGGGIDVEVDSSATHLVNSFGEQDIQKGKATDAAISVLARVNDEFDGNVVREFGLKDEDGNLIIYANHPASEIVAGQPLPLEIGCDIYIENAAVVRVAVTDVIGGAFPINATLALNVNDELYIDENGASWLRSGVTLSNVDDYPLATQTMVDSNVIESYRLTNGTTIDYTTIEGALDSSAISIASNRYNSEIFFTLTGFFTPKAIKHSFIDNSNTASDVTAFSMTSSTDYLYVQATSDGTAGIVEYANGVATGVTIPTSRLYTDLAYAGQDDNGPWFYGLLDSTLFKITATEESEAFALPALASPSSYQGVAHMPGSDSVELLSTIYVSGHHPEVTSVTLESGDVISNVEITNTEDDEWTYCDAIYYDLTSGSLYVAVDTGSTPRNPTFYKATPAYVEEPRVGLEDASEDMNTRLPIYVRIA